MSTTATWTASVPVSRAPERADRRWLTLALLATAQFMVVLDASIVNIAIPHIAAGLHTALSTLAWVITAYVVAFGGLLPLGGRLADLLGRRRTFLAGLGTFTLASLAAGLAPNIGALIATRAVQGAGAALLAPAALSLVTATFTAGAERTKALGVWGAVAAGGATAGVLFGGLLTGGLGWRSVFLINVPIGVAVAALTPRLVNANRPASGPGSWWRRYDAPGAITVTTGLAALVGGLSEGPSWGWRAPATLALLAIGILALIGFIGIERTSAAPLLPLRLLRIATIATGNTIMLLTGAAMLGLFYFLSLYEQIVLGYGAITAGLSQLPMALTLIAAAGIAPLIVKHIGAPATLASGLTLLAAGLAWFGAASAHGSFPTDVLGASLTVGTGLGIAFVPLTDLAVTGVDNTDAGIASGLVNTSQQIGGALGLAALATLATSSTQTALHTHPQLAALTTGYTDAFRAAAAIALLAATITGVAAIRRPSTRTNNA
ncbi:MAG TPA: DHA2 family efflux MFS transporter permease subunit [Jatrophihabitantaceae bacterium]